MDEGQSRSPQPLSVLFAPDWRDGVPYQACLASALSDLGISVEYLRDYKRGLPFWRGLRSRRRTDLAHLHWPEAYYPKKDDGLDLLRVLRSPLDVYLAARNRPLIVTAHNLHAHNRGEERLAGVPYGTAFRLAKAVIAHSEAAREILIEQYGVDPGRLHIVPHGDLSGSILAALPSLSDLQRSDQATPPVCTMFGAVEPYKGIEEVVDFWNAARPEQQLLICGKPISTEYGTAIRDRAKGNEGVTLELRRLEEGELAERLARSSAVIFNYRSIFTSGAAALARSLGIPMLLPSRLGTVELLEPDPRVIRFQKLDRDFQQKLAQACSVRGDYAAASPWREHTAWTRVAALTANIYRDVMSGAPRD